MVVGAVVVRVCVDENAQTHEGILITENVAWETGVEEEEKKKRPKELIGICPKSW